MTYFNKNAELKQGYNPYIDMSADDMGTQMDVGLLVMEPGDTFSFEEAEKEIAVLLFAGTVTYQWAGKTVEAERPHRQGPQRAVHPKDPQRKAL